MVVGGLTPLQRSSQYILQPQLIGKSLFEETIILIVFAPSFLCVWNQIPRRNQQKCFAHTLLIIRRIIIILEVMDRFFENRSDFPQVFSQLHFGYS